MPTSIACPHCAAKLQIPDGFKASQAKCPKCGQPVALTSAAPAKPAGEKPATKRPATGAPAFVASSPVAGANPASAAPPRSTHFPFATWALIGGGALVVVVGILAKAALFFSSVPAGSSRNPNVATASSLAAPTAPATDSAVPSPSVPAPPTAAVPPSAAWVTHNDDPFRFRAAFPVAPSPYDPTAEIADPQERELAAAAMQGRKYLRAEQGGRTYILSAAPLNLGGTPASLYLERMSGAAAAVHRGFQVEAKSEFDLSGNPGLDIALQGDGKRKLLRVVVANGHVYSLIIEGDNNLAFAHADARQFFGGFVPRGAAAGVAPQQIASTATGGNPRTNVATPLATASANEVVDETLGFRITFPSPGATTADLLSTIASPKQRENAADLFPAAQFQQATWLQADGGRQYVVSAFRNLNERDRGAARESSQHGRFDLLTEYLYGRAGRNNRVKYAPTQRHGLEGTDMLITCETGEQALVREVQAGPYSFFVRVEGASGLTRDDPAVQAFFQSLHPPADCPPLPAEGPRICRRDRARLSSHPRPHAGIRRPDIPRQNDPLHRPRRSRWRAIQFTDSQLDARGCRQSWQRRRCHNVSAEQEDQSARRADVASPQTLYGWPIAVG